MSYLRNIGLSKLDGGNSCRFGFTYYPFILSFSGEGLPQPDLNLRSLTGRGPIALKTHQSPLSHSLLVASLNHQSLRSLHPKPLVPCATPP